MSTPCFIDGLIISSWHITNKNNHHRHFSKGLSNELTGIADLLTNDLAGK